MRMAMSVICAVLLAGCATTYQSKGFTGGFSETALAPDIYRVSFTGNRYTDSERAQDFMLLRCADLAVANGYAYFEIQEVFDQSSRTSVYVPKQSYSTGTAQVSTYGNSAYINGSATTTTTGGYSVPIFRPGAGAIVRFVKEKEAGAQVFDANWIRDSLRDKYKIKN